MEAHSNTPYKFPNYYCFSDKCISCQQQNQLRHRPHGRSFVLIGVECAAVECTASGWNLTSDSASLSRVNLK